MSVLSHPAYQNRHIMKELVQPLKVDHDFGSIIIYVILKSEAVTFLSSLPEEDLRIELEGYGKINALSTYYLTKNKCNFVSGSDLGKAQNEIYVNNQRPNSFFSYAISRSCQDCSVLLVYRTKKQDSNPELTYRQTIDRVNSFLVQFFEKMIGVYAGALSGLSVSRFATDPEYRGRVLLDQERMDKAVNLNDVERSILYWSSRGKTAVDLASILELSETTIATYRSKIISKMNVTNILEAVSAGIRCGYIV